MPDDLAQQVAADEKFDKVLLGRLDERLKLLQAAAKENKDTVSDMRLDILAKVENVESRLTLLEARFTAKGVAGDRLLTVAAILIALAALILTHVHVILR